MKKITLAGSCIADVIKYIDFYPNKGMLCKIGKVVRGVGGCVPNTGITLKTLAPDKVDVSVISRVGKDENGAYIREELAKRGIQTDRLIEDATHPTSFSDVMTLPNGERTFFCAEAANEALCERDICVENLDCEIFHIGYLLILKTLDSPDKEYGTKMARLLAKVQARGIKTSIDVVSAEGSRFNEIVMPALRYCDYAVINEIEAGKIAGTELREGKKLLIENLYSVCKKLKEYGVRDTVVIHCPELGCALSADGKFTLVPSLQLPGDYIRGAVGAGDAFCAGMLYSFLFGLDIQEGLRLASCTAACNLHAPDSVSGAKDYEQTMALENCFSRQNIAIKGED